MKTFILVVAMKFISSLEMITNGARAKSMSLHNSCFQRINDSLPDYLIDEYSEDFDSDYVFVNIWEGHRKPNDLFGCSQLV